MSGRVPYRPGLIRETVSPVAGGIVLRRPQDMGRWRRMYRTLRRAGLRPGRARHVVWRMLLDASASTKCKPGLATGPKDRGIQAALAAGVTHRQIDHWASQGALGEHRRSPGPGNYRTFTGHEVAKLVAISRLSADVAALCGQRGVAGPVVADLWAALDESPTATREFPGGLTITVTLPTETGAS